MPSSPSGLWPFPAKAAIFDFDGTLANTASLWHDVDVEFLGRRGLAWDAEYSERLAALGFMGGAEYTIERFGLSETPQQVCDEWTSLSRELYATTVRLRPGAEDYIRRLLAHGIPCALATTNEPAVMDAMENVDVYGLFDACVFGAEVGRGKDHPDIYLEAARRLRAQPGDCLVFEDIVRGVRSARRAGMATCGVRADDPAQDAELLRASSDLWLDDWRDVV